MLKERVKTKKLLEPNPFNCDAVESKYDVDECFEKVEFRVTEKDGQNWYLCKKHYEEYMKDNFVLS